MQLGNYCTHLIEDLYTMREYYSENDWIKVQSFCKAVSSAQKFILPDNAEFYETIYLEDDSTSFNELMREFISDEEAIKSTEITDFERESWHVPYPLTVFEWRNTRSGEQHQVVNLVCFDKETGKSSLYIAVKHPGTPFYLEGTCLVFQKPLDQQHEIEEAVHIYLDDLVERNPERYSGPKQQMLLIASMSHHYVKILRTMTFMRCSNVYVKDVTAPKFLNRKRAKKNKVPFFEYKILEVKSEEKLVVVNDEPIRHHRSPRIHLRRGHIRRYKSGLCTYVSPCVVGNKKRGMVAKSYSMEVH